MAISRETSRSSRSSSSTSSKSNTKKTSSSSSKTSYTSTAAQMAKQQGEKTASYLQEQEKKRSSYWSPSSDTSAYGAAKKDQEAAASRPKTDYWTPESVTPKYTNVGALGAGREPATSPASSGSKTWNPSSILSVFNPATAVEKQANETGKTLESLTPYKPKTNTWSPAQEKENTRSNQNALRNQAKQEEADRKKQIQEAAEAAQRRGEAQTEYWENRQKQEKADQIKSEYARRKEVDALTREEAEHDAAVAIALAQGADWAKQVGGGMTGIEDLASQTRKHWNADETVMPVWENGGFVFKNGREGGFNTIYNVDREGNAVLATDESALKINSDLQMNAINDALNLLRDGNATDADIIRMRSYLRETMDDIASGLAPDTKFTDADGNEYTASELLDEVYTSLDQRRNPDHLPADVRIQAYLEGEKHSSDYTASLLEEAKEGAKTATTERELEYWDGLVEQLEGQLEADKKQEKKENSVIGKAWNAVTGLLPKQKSEMSDADNLSNLRTELAQLIYLRDTALPGEDVDAINRQIESVQSQIDDLAPGVQAEKDAEQAREAEKKQLQAEYDAAVYKWRSTQDPADQAEADRIEAEMREKGLWEEDRFGYGVSSWGKEGLGRVLGSVGSLTNSVGERSQLWDEQIDWEQAEKDRNIGQQMLETSAGLIASGQEDWEQATEGMSGVEKFFAGLAKTGADLALDYGLNKIAPGTGTMRMFLGAGGSEALEQMEKENNDPDSVAIATMKGAVSAWLSNKLIGGHKVYGKGLFSGTLGKLIENMSPEAQKILRPFTNTEGIEEGLENILNWAGDRILDLDPNAVLDVPGTILDSVAGYILGTVTNFLDGGVDIDIKRQKAIADEAVEFGFSGLTIEEAMDIGKENTRDTVVMKPQKETQSNIDNLANPEYNNANSEGVGNYDTGRSAGTDQEGLSGISGLSGEENEARREYNRALRDAGFVPLSDTSISNIQGRKVSVVDVSPTTDYVAFSSALDAAREADPQHGWAVTPKTPEELNQPGNKVLIAPDGSTGLVITPDGDIEAVFKNKAIGTPRSTQSTMVFAIANGGTKLDCFGGNLANIYSQYGFIPVARVTFDPDIARETNPGWDESKGKPDIIFMMHNGDSPDDVSANYGKYKAYTDSDLESLPLMDYDEAMNYRDSLLEQQKQAKSESNSGGTNIPPASGESNADGLTGTNNEQGTNVDAEFESLVDEHGAIEKGEKPARDINVPKRDTSGQKVGEGARTILEADATPEERVSSLKAAVVNGDFSHVPVSNDTRSKNAAKKLNTDGWKKSVGDFLGAVRSGKADADTIALGAHLLNEAGNSTECSGADYIELAMAYNEAVTEAGQKLAAARILKTLTPEGKLYGLEKTVERINDGIREKNAKKSPNKQKPEVKINEDLAEQYLNAKTDEERDAIHDKIVKDIADQVPNTLRDKFTALRYLNMLGNFKTQVRNVVGNVGMTSVQKLKNEVSSVMEGIASAVTGGKYERNYKGFYGRSLYKAAVNDFGSDADLRSAAMGEAKYSDVGKQAESEIQEAKKPFSDKNPVGKFLNLYSKATNAAMEFGDLVFVRANYADALAGYLNAHDITAADWKAMVSDPSKAAEVDKARSYAIKQAQEATFRDTNAVSKFVSTADSRSPKLVKMITQGVVPFRKTPANVLVRMEEYSPLGVINTAANAFMASKGNASASDVIDSLAKTFTGTALAGLGYLLSKGGFARTKDKDDKEEKLAKLRGQQDYSIEFNWNGKRKSFTLDWLTPASGSFFMGVELYNLAKEGGITFAEAETVLSSLTNPMLEMSMLSGVNDALSNLSDFNGDNSAMDQFALNSAWSYLTQGISNTLLGQMEQFSEDYRQTYYTDSNNPLLTTSQQKKLAKLGNKTPGVDYQAADYIDAWGRKQENDENLAARAFNVFLNPGYVSDIDEKATRADEVIDQLYKYGKKQTFTDQFPDVVPKTPSRNTTVNGKTLTPEEYDVYAITKGQEALDAVNEFADSDLHKTMTKNEKAKTISEIYDYSEFLAAAKIAEMRGEDYYDDKYSPLITGVKENGDETYKDPIKEEDIPSYLAFDIAYKSAMNNKEYDVIDDLLASASMLPESAKTGAIQHEDKMNTLKELKAAGLSSTEVYYQFQDDLRESFESEKRAAAKSSDYIKVAGSGRYSNKDADAIMNYETTASEATVNRYQEQVRYNLEQAGMGNAYDDIWGKVQSVADGEMTKDQLKSYLEKNVPIEYRQPIRDVASNYSEDRHVAGKIVSGIYRAVRESGYSPQQALQFYEMIDKNYNGSFTKKELDAACRSAFGRDSAKVRALVSEYAGK